MRIAYDAAPLLNARTGVGHYAATLLDRLLELDPELWFSLFAITRQRDTSKVPQHERVSFRHVRIPARVAVTAWEHSGLASGDKLLFGSQIGEADVVHGTNFWIPPIQSGTGAKGIVTIHDLTFWFYPELCTPQVRRYRWIVPKVLQRCAAVLVPSQTIKEQAAAELGFDGDRIVVTPEGVRNAFTGAVPDPVLTERLGVRGDYLLFVGTQEPRKNLDRLIAAFARLGDKDLQLVIAGPPGWGSVDLPGVVRKLGLDGRVVFSGYLPDEQIGSLMAGARAFVFPTLYEGFGLPPLEAMAAGVPVVAARAGSLPEVLGDAPFWCDPLDVDSIAEAIGRAGDGEARASAVEQGRKRAASYDWRATAELTLETYRRVAAGD
ncbi:MAG: glycosyltransferase family 4 protein [Actinomycetota bacterium]